MMTTPRLRSRLLASVLLGCLGPATCVLGGLASPPDQTPEQRLQLDWKALLDLARLRSEEAKTRVRETARKDSREPVRRLAELLLREWGLDRGVDSLAVPQLVRRPAIDFAALPKEALRVSSASLRIRGHVAQDGRLRSAQLMRSSGSPLLDQAALAAAQQALFRPALGPDGYKETMYVLEVHLDPR